MLIGVCGLAEATTTDLATAPLASSTASVVKPNVLFTLDDSGSMAWNYLPDYAGGTTYTGGTATHCKVSNTCGDGETPFQATDYNGIAYNPGQTYKQPINADGTLKPSFGSPWTAVKVDGYDIQSASTTNLTNGYPEILYCSGSTCKKNGVHTNNPFILRATVSSDNPPVYAFPGTLPGSTTVSSTIQNGAMNQSSSTSIFSGTLDISTAVVTTTLTGVSIPVAGAVGGGKSTLLSGVSVSKSGSTVTVNYTALSPALATGDTVVISGGSCGTAYTGSSLTITVSTSTRFTYTVSGGTTTAGSSCTIYATKVNQTITVTYNALTPPLATNDTIVVSGGTCGTGYKSGGGNLSITRVDATHFTYISTTGYTSTTGANWGTSCTIIATHAAHTANTTLTGAMISKAGTGSGTSGNRLVTVTLASAPTPALATGTLMTVSGSGCDAGYRVTGVAMTRISNFSFSYNATTAVSTATNTNCTITQTGPPASPGISLSGSTVTVYKTAHGLTTGNVIQVTDGSGGTCDTGYTTGSTVTVTVIDTNTFTYTPPEGAVTTNSNCRIDKMLVTSSVTYSSAGTTNGNPYYFELIPVEYCDSIYLTHCVATTAPVTISGVTYDQPAPVRFCKDDATAALPPGDSGAQLSGSTINCQGKYSVGTGLNFRSVRYGLFWRGDIVPSRTTYGNENYSGTITGTDWASSLTFNNTLVVDRSKRGDCAAPPNCTYAEEMTNFANWYAYYGTRMQMMKSAGGLAFSVLDNRYRIGFITINPSSSEYLSVAPFDATQKTNWYAKLYAVNPGNSTPLREGLANAGRYFAGKDPWSFATDDPMEYACQENFVLITTDGYWNGTDSSVKQINGSTTMGNYDNVDSGTSKRADGAYDGGTGATDTLADVAMYYYKTDLRNSSLSNCTGTLGADVCEDIVPMTAKDTAAGLAGTQHMVTYALGLADGLMTYQPDYDTASTGDFYNIKHGVNGCSFSGSGVCNWPLPVHDSQTALDDLWHAAVNGRGAYYNARDPASLSTGLSSALTKITITTAAAAASATSSPNITQTDRSIFSSTYRTAAWDGEVTAQLVDPLTGIVLAPIIWSAQTQLDTLIHADTSAGITSRHVYMFDDTNANGNNLKNFTYGSLTSTGSPSEQSYFDNNCSFTLLTQCSSATLSAQAITNGNSGLNLVHYLRGNQTLELGKTDGAFRARDHLLGDTVDAKPAYVKLPSHNFTDAVTPSYAAFKATQTAIPRQGALYMGSNDGMLHAFNTDTGAEMWAYVPKIVMPNLYKLAETSYATLHQYYVDGSPETMDIFVSTPANGLDVGWHTILVAGLGLGGRGYYALDVTDPANPQALWEICSDSTLCGISDADLGYSYGNPVIVKRSSDGAWVVLVASGYNNASPGSGAGTLFELDAVNGTVLNKTTTGTTTNPPSGLSKLSPWLDTPSTDYTARYVYGGDLNGNVWRFDLGAAGSAGTPTATKIASLVGPACASPCLPVSTAPAQSVTTRPMLGDPLNNASNSLSGTGTPSIFVATGRYLGTTDLSNVQVQSIYAIKDDWSKTGSSANIGNPRSPNTGFTSFVKQYIYNTGTGATQRTTSTYSVNWNSNQGWYADFVVSDSATNLPLSPSASPGERVNLDPLLASGTLIVATNIASSSACTIGGYSWLYSFDFLTGQYVSTSANSIVAQKLGSFAVGINLVRTLLGEGKIEATTADAKMQTLSPVLKASATKRASWRELTQ
jgi:type IV pilus assembly protein PilY1